MQKYSYTFSNRFEFNVFLFSFPRQTIQVSLKKKIFSRLFVNLMKRTSLHHRVSASFSHLFSSPSTYTFFFLRLSWADFLLRIFLLILFSVRSSACSWKRTLKASCWHDRWQCSKTKSSLTFVRGMCVGIVAPSLDKRRFSSSVSTISLNWNWSEKENSCQINCGETLHSIMLQYVAKRNSIDLKPFFLT